jgi:hypothetical protein
LIYINLAKSTHLGEIQGGHLIVKVVTGMLIAAKLQEQTLQTLNEQDCTQKWLQLNLALCPGSKTYVWVYFQL